VLHFPIVLTVSALHQSWLASVNVHLLAAASVALILALATAASTFYDAPLRRRLTRIMAQEVETPGGIRIRSPG
jgi:peptidoglycan/LPS O-acetylase OafA/YrhL